MEVKFREYVELNWGSVDKFIKKQRGRIYCEYSCKYNHSLISRIDVFRKEFCPDCRKDRYIDQCHIMAQEYGGKFITNMFIDTHYKYEWMCKNGHTFTSAFHTVKHGHWCRKCRGLTIGEIKEIAVKRHGECLSELYEPGKKIKFRCQYKHEWLANPSAVKRGTWCPYCVENTSETLCRKILEYIYKKTFPKQRPDWLTNSDGNRMELDGYCDELKIAMERNGKQHYKFVDYFHQSDDDFEHQKKKDQERIEICTRNKVHLITIPYTVKYEDTYTFILKHCINVPDGTPESIDYNVLNVKSGKQEKMDDIHLFLQQRYGGGTLINPYTNNYSKLKWKCREGHDVVTTWSEIQQNTYPSFCTICNKNALINLRETYVEKFCEINKLKKDSKYTNAKTKINWTCIDCGVTKNYSWDTIISVNKVSIFKCKCYKNLKYMSKKLENLTIKKKDIELIDDEYLVLD